MRYIVIPFSIVCIIVFGCAPNALSLESDEKVSQSQSRNRIIIPGPESEIVFRDIAEETAGDIEAEFIGLFIDLENKVVAIDDVGEFISKCHSKHTIYCIESVFILAIPKISGRKVKVAVRGGNAEAYIGEFGLYANKNVCEIEKFPLTVKYIPEDDRENEAIFHYKISRRKGVELISYTIPDNNRIPTMIRMLASTKQGLLQGYPFCAGEKR